DRVAGEPGGPGEEPALPVVAALVEMDQLAGERGPAEAGEEARAAVGAVGADPARIDGFDGDPAGGERALELAQVDRDPAGRWRQRADQQELIGHASERGARSVSSV